MIKEIKIPDIGEKVESGQVVEILVKKGESVQLDQGILEMETDKAVVEIPTEDSGVITEILVKEGDTVTIGQVVAKIDTEGSADDSGEESGSATEKKEEKSSEESKEKESKEDEPEEKESEPERPERKQAAKKAPPPEPKKSDAPAKKPIDIPASPSVRHLARELGVDIARVSGSGPGGRITAEDVKKFVHHAVDGDSGTPKQAQSPGGMPDFSQWGDVYRVPLTQVRKLISQSTSNSWSMIPHVTQFDEADISHVNAFIEKHRGTVAKEGGKLTVTAVLLKVMAKALQRFPKFNASIDVQNEELILKKYVHIGMAVDTDRGLLVPVIRDADKKGIVELAADLKDIADRTRDKKVKPDEMEGGTFTISNQGSIGGTNFTPIVLWPQVAILGVSRTAARLVENDGDIEKRHFLPLALSYDHRVIDGADAARFLRWVAEALESPLLLHLEG